MTAAADSLMGVFGLKRVKQRKPKCANKACRIRFTPSQPLQVVCSWQCGLIVGRERKAKAEKKAIEARKEAVKRPQDLKAEAQAAFNAFIRFRDLSAGHPCICCGKPFEPQKPGGSVDAGHYLSRGSAPHLRFAELNVHAQRKNCNRPGGTTRESFRSGMIDRIGLEAVEALESDQAQTRYRSDDYRAIRDQYRAKLKEMKRVLLAAREIVGPDALVKVK